MTSTSSRRQVQLLKLFEHHTDLIEQLHEAIKIRDLEVRMLQQDVRELQNRPLARFFRRLFHP